MKCGDEVGIILSYQNYIYKTNAKNIGVMRRGVHAVSGACQDNSVAALYAVAVHKGLVPVEVHCRNFVVVGGTGCCSYLAYLLRTDSERSFDSTAAVDSFLRIAVVLEEDIAAVAEAYEAGA